MNVRKHYTWESHGQKYASAIRELMTTNRQTDLSVAKPSDPVGRRLMQLRRFLITDIDNTLIGEDNEWLDKLVQIIATHRDQMGFGIATGRTIESARRILKKNNIPKPDILICSVGSTIYYGRSNKPGSGWASHIASRWNRKKIVDLLKAFAFLEYQEEETQKGFKISYYMAPDKDRLAMVHDHLLKNGCRYNLIYSHDRYLDILPYRASKGKAIRYLSYKWDIPLGNFMVCGDSGNDEEMLRGEPLAIVVANYSHELKKLKGSRNVYFADQPCAGGIIEGLQHYNFIDGSAQFIRKSKGDT
jgi:sucrose-phosphate synthase